MPDRLNATIDRAQQAANGTEQPAAPVQARPIFRPEAVRRYVASRDQAVLPPVGVPQTALFVWLLLMLFVLSAGVAWYARVPRYLSGTALVVERSATTSQPPTVDVVGLFPPDHLAQLSAGQRVVLRFDITEQRTQQAYVRAEPELLSRIATIERFGLTAATDALAHESVAVVPLEIDRAAVSGAQIGRADVAVGTRRLIELLPLVGPLVGGGD